MFITQNINAAKSAEIGNVITHVIIIRCAVFHLTPLALLEAPTPRIDDDTTCVVDNGKCNDEATNIVNADDKSAAAPFAGRIFIMFPPTVLIIFHPPIAVPRPLQLHRQLLPIMPAQRL